MCTIAGIFAGSALPDSLPLDFAVPLVFLVLLVPAITSRPSAVAAMVGGGVALLAAEAGASHLSVLFGALAGIVAGAIVESFLDRRAPRDPRHARRTQGCGAVSDAWVAIVLAGIGTYAMRASFLVFAHRLADVPPVVQRLLRQIPPAALAAIVIPALLRPEGYIECGSPASTPGSSPRPWPGARGTSPSPSSSASAW